MKLKISESDFLVIWDALHTEATIESVALALKLARARARSRANKNFSRRGAVAAQKRDAKKHVPSVAASDCAANTGEET